MPPPPPLAEGNMNVWAETRNHAKASPFSHGSLICIITDTCTYLYIYIHIRIAYAVLVPRLLLPTVYCHCLLAINRGAHWP